MALAGRLGYNICILNLSERGLTDDRLALALSNIPPQVSQCFFYFDEASVCSVTTPFSTSFFVTESGAAGGH